MIDIKIIQHQGHSALVEYLSGKKIKRVTIPANVIHGEQVSKYNLNLGIPYGVDWARRINLKASPQKLEDELHRVGIWTADDALQNANKLLGAIQATYAVDLSTLLRIAKNAGKE